MRLQKTLRAMRAAFPHTLPVLTGYLFLGMAFGLLLHRAGYGPLWALLMSLFIYAGSMQFVAVGLLAGGFAPLSAFLLTLMINARHIFYGLSMLTPFAALGRAKPYMVFALTDETFPLLLTAQPPADVSPTAFRVSIAALDQLYWVTGSVLGGALGTALPLDLSGIEFAMTALFAVIFLKQWESRKGRIPAVIGLGTALLCRVLFGADWFLLPAMALIAACLMLARPQLQRRDAP